MVKTFNGDGDVTNWLKKAKLVARLKKIVDLATFLPLYLEGPAFEVFDQKIEVDKMDSNKIKCILLSAFAQNIFTAYELFRQRSWMAGEQVDVFLAELRKLARG